MLGGYLSRLVWIGLPYVLGRLVRVYVVLGLDKINMFTTCRGLEATKLCRAYRLAQYQQRVNRYFVQGFQR